MNFSTKRFISYSQNFDHRVSKLLSVEVFNNIIKLQSRITIKWPAN